MKTLLTFGSVSFIAPDMQTAGKIADLIMKLKPVVRDYRNSKKHVLVEVRGREHDIGIQTLSAEVEIVKDLKSALKLRAPEDEKDPGLL